MSYGEQVRRRVAMLNTARNVARSGEHANWESVAAEMEVAGDFRDVRRAFEADWTIRAQLDELCRAAGKGQTVPRGPRGARESEQGTRQKGRNTAALRSGCPPGRPDEDLPADVNGEDRCSTIRRPTK